MLCIIERMGCLKLSVPTRESVRVVPGKEGSHAEVLIGVDLPVVMNQPGEKVLMLCVRTLE